MSQPLHITAQGVSKHYTLHDGSKKSAVDALHFSIHEGERVGIIGRNGAGKTTLLRMLAGIAPPSEGSFSIQGKVTAVLTIGMGLREDLSGRENIYIDSELHGRSRHETDAIIESIIAFSELGDFIENPVRTYSTGMKARLSFAMLTHIDPEILIIDEALSVGDAAFSAKATAKMNELAARGKILIVVSHSMTAITDMCTRCLWMDNGKLRMDGAPEAVTTAYIDEVREADEHLLVTRFQHMLVNESLRPGWNVRQLQFREAASKKPLQVLRTGEVTELVLSLQAPPHMRCRASLEIFRLDGIAVCHSQSAELTANADGRIERVLHFGALPLNHGLYGVRLSIRDAEGTLARNTICTEIVNPLPPRGGRPLLITPIHVTTERLV